MIEDSMRIDCHAAKAGDHLLGSMSDREAMRMDRQLAFDPAFQGKVVALAKRLRPHDLDDRVADLLPVVVDDAWRRRTRSLRRLGPARTRGRRALWPANDRDSRRKVAGVQEGQSMLSVSLVAFAVGFALTGAAALVLAPGAGTLAALLR